MKLLRKSFVQRMLGRLLSGHRAPVGRTYAVTVPAPRNRQPVDNVVTLRPHARVDERPRLPRHAIAERTVARVVNR
jgi:hypothetical protein